MEYSEAINAVNLLADYESQLERPAVELVRTWDASVACKPFLAADRTSKLKISQFRRYRCFSMDHLVVFVVLNLNRQFWAKILI